MSKKAVVWIRDDFRIKNNSALSYATNNYDTVTALYIYNKENFDDIREAQKWWVSKSLINLVSEEVLASAISTVNPDGIAALVEISSLTTYQFNSKDDFVLVLDRIQDPGNMGNIFRTALAAGVDAIFLAGGAHPLSQKVLRASSGAVFHQPF